MCELKCPKVYIMSAPILNYKARIPDSRDHTYTYSPETCTIVMNEPNISTKVYKSSAPPSATSSHILAPINSIVIYDQGGLGSCVSNAYAQCINIITKNTFRLSRLYLYYNGRAIEGDDLYTDTGISVYSGSNSISQYGVCAETAYPYDITKFANLPSLSAYKSAITLLNYKYIFVAQTVASLINALTTTTSPIVFGTNVYDSFMTVGVANTGIIPIPNTTKETLQGGHCLCIVGYDNTKKWFIVANCWGKTWGAGGFCYIPYSYIIDPNLCFDFHVIGFSLPVLAKPKLENPQSPIVAVGSALKSMKFI